MPDFRNALGKGRIILFDGAMGTMLQDMGLPPGTTPEAFGMERPDVVRRVHQSFRDAGADVLTTNTFGGTRYKLGNARAVRDLNRAMAAVAREVAGDELFVAGSVGSTGHFVRPLGNLEFQDLVEAFREQIQGLVEGGVDLILAETHFDLAEVRAVAVAARQVTDLPVGLSMTLDKCVTLTGTGPLTFLDSAQNMGVDLVGINCGDSPERLYDCVKAMLPRLDTPLLVEPNAGLPEMRDGRTVFTLGAEPFAETLVRFAELGATCLGGCCGTTPEHIARARAALEGVSARRPEPRGAGCIVLTSRTRSVPIGLDREFVVIGERINPTGKKRLTEELQAGEFTQALAYAEEQVAAGAKVLDVNVGAPMVDETALLPELSVRLMERIQAPLCLDSPNGEALERALGAYAGSALVNSISGEPGRMERLGPLCRDLGAPFILLPLKGKKLPVTADERLAILEELLEQADALRIPRRLMLVDVLALAVSSKPEAARHCLETIRRCREQWGLPTVIGLSNISFGLPARELINSTFLSLCMAHGLAACIANPGSARLGEARRAAELLLGRDPQAEEFIARYADWKPGQEGGVGSGAAARTAAETVRQAVVTGDRDNVVPLVEAELDRGASPFAVVDEMLIPAITEVGAKYERREYFLPQLILSAETMQRAFERLKPLLEQDSQARHKPVAVMATVEGDIHDIGKNIVCLMLRNHGFEVVDLGKDVPAQAIVDEAQARGAALIGLSALMTTTMVRMRDTVDLVRERGLDCKVMVGGAVVTEQFAASIGAHGHALDAVGAVRTALELAGTARAGD